MVVHVISHTESVQIHNINNIMRNTSLNDIRITNISIIKDITIKKLVLK